MTVSLTQPARGAVDVAAALNQNWTDVEGALNGLPPAPGLFGDGSDGDVTVSSNTSLSRDMFYEALTVDSSAVLTTNGFRVFARTSVTVESGAAIRHDGEDGTSGAGGAGAASGSVGGGGDGGFGSSGDGAFSSLGGDGGDGTSSGGSTNPPFTGYRTTINLLSGLVNWLLDESVHS